MPEITLTTAYKPGFTAVPDVFLEKYMPEANGEYVKVYLYLLKKQSGHSAFTLSDIADALEKEETDILRALKYWDKRGVITLAADGGSGKNISGIILNDLSGTITENTAFTEKAFKSSQSIPKESKEIPEDVTFLITACEGYFARPLTLSDKDILLYLYDDLGLSYDLIDFLLCRAVETGKKQLRYIEKVAISLHEDGITTVKEASEKFKESSEITHTVMRCFGLQARQPSPAEKKLIDKWSDTFAFDKELIEEACTRSIMNTNSGNFQYADKILSSWHEAGVKSLKDVEALDAQHKANAAKSPRKKTASAKTTGFHNFEERTDKVEDIERKLLGES